MNLIKAYKKLSILVEGSLGNKRKWRVFNSLSKKGHPEIAPYSKRDIDYDYKQKRSSKDSYSDLQKKSIRNSIRNKKYSTKEVINNAKKASEGIAKSKLKK